MARHLKLDATYLEPDEVAYERRIRNERPLPPHAMLMSEMGILVRWIESETEDPVTIPHQLNDDQMNDEIDLCCQRLNELTDEVTAKFVVTETFDSVGLEEAKKLASRLVHYDYRIRRIDSASVNNDAKASMGKLQRRGIVARTILAGAISALTTHTQENNVSAQPSIQHDQSSTAAHNTDPLTVHQDTSANGPQQGQQIGPSIPLNSTVNNLDVSVEQTAFNVRSEMQRRTDAEAARRVQEYEICVGRIDELHEDISEEYCSAVSPRRPSEASKFMSRLLGLESVLKCLLSSASEAQFRRNIESQLSRLVRDAYILYTNMVIHAQNTNGPMPGILHPSLWQPQSQPTRSMPANQTQVIHSRANSTMHQGQGQANPHTSVPLLPFEQAVNGLTFNLPPTMGIQDTSLSRGVDEVLRNTQHNRGTGQVAFNLQPQVIDTGGFSSPNQTPMLSHMNQPSSQSYTQALSQQPQQQQQSHTTMVQPQAPQTTTPGDHDGTPPLPITANVSNTQTNVSSASIEPRRHANRTYHPAIATSHFPEYAAIEPSEESRLAAEAQIGRLPSMNPCQGQQYLARVLGNRRYEGTVTHAKAIPLDEFIGHARAYQKSTGSPEAVVVGQLTTFFSEEAFDWWQANSDRITGLSIDELESALKSRFERKSNDSMALYGEFCSRKQAKDEDLLRYIDQMLIMAKRCVMQPPLSVPQIISRIVDNANEIYRKTLASQRYATIPEMSLFAEYIVRNESVKPKTAASNQTGTQKKAWTKPLWLKNDADIEAAEPSSVNETEPEPPTEAENTDQLEALCTITRELAKLSTNLMRGCASAQFIQTQKNDRMQQNPMDIYCWSCKTPGVYRRNCPKCPPLTKNESIHPI